MQLRFWIDRLIVRRLLARTRINCLGRSRYAMTDNFTRGAVPRTIFALLIAGGLLSWASVLTPVYAQDKAKVEGKDQKKPVAKPQAKDEKKADAKAQPKSDKKAEISRPRPRLHNPPGSSTKPE